jgi:predicted amidohydrolase
MPSSKINLVAVQAKMGLADYRSGETFCAKILSLMDAVAQAVDLSLPTLVSFPELIGMYLTFVPFYWDDVKEEASVERAGTRIVMRNLSRLNEDDRVSPELAARRLLFVEHALEAERMYVETFAFAARKFSVYVAAGSIALPLIESEPGKGGRHIADPGSVHNTAYLFAPSGVCLNRVPKVNLVGGFEERVFDPGRPTDLVPAKTVLGAVGTLICYDGFHETLVERYDSLGVRVLLKPSYNQHPWNGPCSYDPEHTEGENWLKSGCPSIIQGRENIRYGVNAMLVGAVFEDMRAEGLSSVAVNTGRPGANWEQAVLAIASHPDAEEVVAATVEAA